MRSTLHVKFFLVYIVFGFLSIFTVETLASTLTMNRLEKHTAESICKRSTLMADDYLPSYFTNKLSLSSVKTQLTGMSDYLGANVWFTDIDGTLIMSATQSDQPSAPVQIQNFNPAENGSMTYRIGTYHNYFAEDVLTIITPVTIGFSTQGYLLVHKPYSSPTQECDTLLNTIHITVLVIYLLSLSILFAIHFFIYRPLRKITEAAKQYASGNLEYEIPVTTQDEIGYLSASLNYMSTQLRDMEDYQKKFIANVSHDFRSPLTSIKGYLEAMADGTIPVEMQDRYFKIILFETDRLTDLTRDLLTLNEFDTKNLMLDRSDFDIHEVIKNTATSFEGICTSKKISIELLFASKILNVNADKRKIQQVLYNLLDNAIKFSPADSKITIETTEHNEKIFVAVKDRGIGIPKKVLQKSGIVFIKQTCPVEKTKKEPALDLQL